MMQAKKDIKMSSPVRLKILTTKSLQMEILLDIVDSCNTLTRTPISAATARPAESLRQ